MKKILLFAIITLLAFQPGVAEAYCWQCSTGQFTYNCSPPGHEAHCGACDASSDFGGSSGCNASIRRISGSTYEVYRCSTRPLPPCV